jgi:cell division protein FtsB
MAYLRNRPSHGKEIYYILCIFVVVLITLSTIWGPGGYLELRKAKQDLENQHNRVEALKKTNEDRMRSIQALRSDPETLERHAREKGYGKGDEIVQQLPEAD